MTKSDAGKSGLELEKTTKGPTLDSRHFQKPSTNNRPIIYVMSDYGPAKRGTLACNCILGVTSVSGDNYPALHEIKNPCYTSSTIKCSINRSVRSVKDLEKLISVNFHEKRHHRRLA